jgi:hypothetical protein
LQKVLNKFFLLLLCALPLFVSAQKKIATISGKVIDENDQPLANVSVQVLAKDAGTTTNDSGFFKIQIPANHAVALVFSYTSYKNAQKNFFLEPNEKRSITIKLQPSSNELKTVVVKDNHERQQSGLINIDASKALVNPSPISGVESLIKVFVGSNNELTSQYSVRGGNYDENLVYVNDFEVYRPYLVNNAQQEGLSFINPELTDNVKFYTGGFQAKYGDKMSSALDVTYRKPTEDGGSAYLGLLEQGIHFEGTAHHKKVTYLIGARNRSDRNLLSNQETQGNYIPSSADLQALVTWQVSNKWQLQALTNLSQTKFTFIPVSSTLTSAVFSPLYSEDLGLDIFFNGQEKDKYSTSFVGLTAINQINKNFRLKWMASYFGDMESQNQDISGSYLFGEVDFDQSSPTFGSIINPLGSGTDQNFSRDQLNINVYNASLKGEWTERNNFFQFGNSIERQTVSVNLDQWEFSDSAGYSQPYNPDELLLNNVLKTDTSFALTRFTGYAQDNIQFKDSSQFTLQVGARYNYNTLNNQFLVSPRAGFSFKPKRWQKDIIFKGSAGIYDQPPFFREMLRYDGTINTQLKAQQSWQATAGMDYNFKMFDRPAKFTSEAYYKYMTDVDPYDISNVQIQYFGENNAKAYAAGVEGRLFAQIVKDAESWLSLSFMHTEENISNYNYNVYKNKEGQIITRGTTDQVVKDTVSTPLGWVRRPSDRLITFGMFFQDYLSTNKNFKVYLNTLYGSNLPYSIPNEPQYRDALIIDPYIRIDIGFSALLLDPEKVKRSHSPFKPFKSIWASFEVFNLINHENTISYMLIKDYANDTYAVPNTLTPRLVNFKIAASW